MFRNAVQTRNWRKSWSKKNSNPALVEDFYNMQKLFDQKAWSSYPGYYPILQSHVGTMRKLNDEEKDLYLELTNRFIWIRDYTSSIVDQLNQILTHFTKYTSYYVIRCIPLKDQKWSKSSGVMLYEIKNPEVRKQLVKPITIVDKIEDIDQLSDVSTSLFILVDDFVGTGDTAEKCIKDLVQRSKAISGRMIIMCVAALQQGVSRLSGLNVPVFADHILKKGISDYNTGYNLVKKKQLMQQIESRLHISQNFSLGYGSSEALICLKRCPNNTFPIFWYDSRYSPYPRY